jgi:hypothetical protein
MSVVCVYGVIPSELLKSVVPLGCGAKDSEIEIEFGHAESVGTSFFECSDNLLVFCGYEGSLGGLVYSEK